MPDAQMNEWMNERPQTLSELGFHEGRRRPTNQYATERNAIDSLVLDPDSKIVVLRKDANIPEKILLYPVGIGRIAWRSSNCDEHQQDILPPVGWPRFSFVLSTSKQHWNRIYNDSNKKFPSGLPLKYYPGLMMLNFSVRTGTGESNMPCPLASKGN